MSHARQPTPRQRARRVGPARVAATSTWPSTFSAKAWVVATAGWALRLPPRAEKRAYAHYALDAMVELGLRADARRLAGGLLADARPPVEAIEAAAKAYAALGDHADARRAIARLAALAAQARQKSDRAYYLSEEAALLHECGFAPAPAPEPPGGAPVEIAARLVELHARGGDAKAIARLLRGLNQAQRTMPVAEALADAGLRAPALVIAKRCAAAAERELGPEQWNVHDPAGTLSRAIVLLFRAGEADPARALLDKTLKRFARGDLDGRGFASAGAYLTLARAATRVGRTETAKTLLARALAVAGSDRQLLLVELADAHAALGAIDEALALAAKVRSPARRASASAGVLFVGKRREALHASLAEIDDPGVAAEIAWGLALRALGRA